MHILLFSFLFTSSFNHLQAKIDENNNGFTLDLLHRYSPISPFHNSSLTFQERLQRLALTSASRHRHIKKLLTTDFDTTIIPNNGDYLINISIGIPPSHFFVVADTGSDLIWVQCEPCYRCYSPAQATFNSQMSRTFETLPCNSTYCANTPNMECDADTNQECEYFYAYGDGTTLTAGVMGRDLITFASNMSSPCVFGCGLLEEGGGFDPDAAGLVGLGGGPLSLISQLGPTIANRFSYCLTPTTSNNTSKLRLGSHSSNANSGSEPAVITPLVSLEVPTYYAINLKGISFNKNEIQAGKGMIIDSGSTLTYLGAASYAHLEEMVREVISAEPMKNPPRQLSLCYNKTDFNNANAPFDMALQFDGGDLKLDEQNIFLDFGDFVCLAFVPPEEEDDPMILGNVSQVNFEVVFDLREKMVSFTPRICSQTN